MRVRARVEMLKHRRSARQGDLVRAGEDLVRAGEDGDGPGLAGEEVLVLLTLEGKRAYP